MHFRCLIAPHGYCIELCRYRKIPWLPKGLSECIYVPCFANTTISFPCALTPGGT